jgi:hypothetical protein
VLYGPCHDAIRFELPQVLPEYLDSYSWNGPPKLAKSESATAKAAKNHRLPATFNHLYRRVNGTPVSFDVACTLFAHVACPKRIGYFKVPTCETTRTNILSVLQIWPLLAYSA